MLTLPGRPGSFASISQLVRIAAFTLGALFALSTAGCAGDQGDEGEVAGEESQEAAFTAFPPSEYPSESGWSLYMITRACKVSSDSLKGAVGTTEEVDDGVVYTATRSGKVLGRAWAKSTFIGASKRCIPL